jgi:hypothetical protein
MRWLLLLSNSSCLSNHISEVNDLGKLSPVDVPLERELAKSWLTLAIIFASIKLDLNQTMKPSAK